MEPRSKKAIVCLVIVASVVVLVAAGFALKRPIIEQWYVWQLESQDEQERTAAIGKLVDMRSVRAVPYLISMLPGDSDTRKGGPILVNAPPWQEHWAAKAIAAIGAQAVPAIAEAIKDETWLYGGRVTMDIALRTAIQEMGSSAASHLMEMLDAKNPNTRRLAALVLRKLDHEPERALEALLEAHRAAWGIGEFSSVTEDSSSHAVETPLRDEVGHPIMSHVSPE